MNVWSRGAYVEEGRTFARLGLELRNTGTQPVALDADFLQLDAFDADGQRLPPARLVHSAATYGSFQVMPGDASTMELLYELPVTIDPDRIGSMRLRWAVDHADQRRYVQFTDFRRIPEYTASTGVYYYDPVFGYYDPFLYGPPYGYHSRYRYPVGRVIIQQRDRPPRTVRRDR